MNQQLVMQSSICDLDTLGYDLKPFILEKWQPLVTLIWVCTITFKPAEQSRLQLSIIDPRRPSEAYLTGRGSACWSEWPRSSETVVCSHLEVEPVGSKHCGHLTVTMCPRHNIVRSRQRTALVRRTRLSDRIKCGSSEMPKFTPD